MGSGTRVPAIVISPFAKQGFVDHQQHDTLSILSTIEARFGLQPLNQADANASTLSVDFHKGSNSQDDNSENAGQSQGETMATQVTGHITSGVAPDILTAAKANGQSVSQGQPVATSNGTSQKSIWAASTDWMNSGKDIATSAANVLNGAGQQKIGGLGMNWETFDPTKAIDDMLGLGFGSSIK
jgi:hypothetical protein